MIVYATIKDKPTRKLFKMNKYCYKLYVEQHDMEWKLFNDYIVLFNSLKLYIV